jgi:RNA polymerase sigma factor (sigma-70 family)
VKPRPPLPLTEYRKLSDEDVIHRYVHRHEAQAMNCLYERYAHLVLGVCFKYLKDGEQAKDATQQIFIKLLEDLKRFEIVYFKAWLMQVTRNFCLMQLRQSIPVVNNTIPLPDSMEFEDDVHPLVEREILLNELETAVAGLNEEQRTCITLFYLQKMTYTSIAERTGYTMMEVKSNIQNGRRNLKIKLIHLTTAGAAQL